MRQSQTLRKASARITTLLTLIGFVIFAINHQPSVSSQSPPDRRQGYQDPSDIKRTMGKNKAESQRSDQSGQTANRNQGQPTADQADAQSPDAGQGGRRPFLRTENIERKFEELMTKARESGLVRVIVGLRVEYQSEGAFASDDEISRQRETIAQAQDRLINRLSGYSR